MKKIDKDGLILCDIQAKAFEISITAMNTSSEIFVRRFMNSKIAKEMDNLSVLQDNLQAKDILDRIDEEYGKSDYGSVKYTKNEMYWIGYLYRYFAYTYNMSSIQVYKIVKPKELRGLFLPYHTMDTAQAIDRIIEAKGIAIDSADEEKRQYEIYKCIRSQSVL
ncbi:MULTISPECIES: antitoxin [Eubacterium]|uniref:antitoxin n=1 Tax=Eubacterium TaxID=1730 RepID=UPI001569DD49|nr:MULTISPECIES: antitoxin [Eubacterium]MCR5367179.1 antitoxin [Eubacterium sp.]